MNGRRGSAWLLLLNFSGFFYFVRSLVSEKICSKEIHCFKCRSGSQEGCGDPFNVTLAMHTGVLSLPCNGCCVKFRHITELGQEELRRTCTAWPDLQIEAMLISRVCIPQWKTNGTMCICDTPNCNSASVLRPMHGAFPSVWTIAVGALVGAVPRLFTPLLWDL